MKVRCINNEDVPCLLTKNKIYEAKKDIKTWGNFYEIIADRGFKHTFSQKRFEEVKESDTVIKVRCINTSGKFKQLTKNRIYEALKEYDNYYQIINDNNILGSYFRERFEEVKEMTYNEILMDFCTKKNDLINKALAEEEVHGIYYMVKEDFDEVKLWDEEICKKILEKLDFGDTSLCPWCLKRNVEEKDCKEWNYCKYGKRHGNCVDDSESTYKIIRTIFQLSSIKGIEELFNQTKKQYKLLAEQEKYTEKPNPIEMEPLKTYVVEFKYNNSNDIVRKICMYFGGCFEKKSVLWLRKYNGFDYVGEENNKFSWSYGKITKVIANVTEMLYEYGIKFIEREYGCERY